MKPVTPNPIPQPAAPQIPLQHGALSDAKTPRPPLFNRSSHPVENPKKMYFAKQSEPDIGEIPSPTPAKPGRGRDDLPVRCILVKADFSSSNHFEGKPMLASNQENFQ
jgi:hypothetical protein